jgi:hypothetical protein
MEDRVEKIIFPLPPAKLRFFTVNIKKIMKKSRVLGNPAEYHGQILPISHTFFVFYIYPESGIQTTDFWIQMVCSLSVMLN